MAEKIVVNSSYTELSEHKNYLELVNLVSYYNYPNGNGTQIDYGTTDEEKAATLERAKTMEFMPVKAFYSTNAQGEPTFGGHEASYDENGNLVFGTEKIGVHKSVYIKTANVTAADGTKRRLPCLYAKQRIWTDKPNVVAAIKRLHGLGKLNSSWEAQVLSYEFKNGVKFLRDYEFIGNAYLGFDDKRGPKNPAYGQDAKVISVSSQEEENYELMIAEALAKDLIENSSVVIMPNENEVEIMSEEMKLSEGQEPEISEAEESTPEVDTSAPETEVPATDTPETIQEEPEVSEQQSATEHEEEVSQPENSDEQLETEVSALTAHDLMHLLIDAYRNETRHWGYCSFLFVEEHVAWMHGEHMLETEFDQVSYTVENDEVKISAIERVKIALPVRELSQKYDELTEKTAHLEAEVSTLAEYKTKYEAVEQAEKKKQHDAEANALRVMIEESACFTPEEISGMEPMIDNLQKLEIQAKIGERLMSQKKQKVEVSEHSNSEELPKSTLETEVSTNGSDEFRRWLYS